MESRIKTIDLRQVTMAEYKSEYSAVYQVHKAMSIKQPWASKIDMLEKWIEVRSRPTNWRGDFVVCASMGKDNVFSGDWVDDLPRGVVMCLAELYDCKPLSEMTVEELAGTCLPPAVWDKYEKLGHYGYFLRNVRSLVRRPVRGQLGLFNLYSTTGYIEQNTAWNP